MNHCSRNQLWFVHKKGIVPPYIKNKRIARLKILYYEFIVQKSLRCVMFLALLQK